MLRAVCENIGRTIFTPQCTRNCVMNEHDSVFSKSTAVLILTPHSFSHMLVISTTAINEDQSSTKNYADQAVAKSHTVYVPHPFYHRVERKTRRIRPKKKKEINRLHTCDVRLGRNGDDSASVVAGLSLHLLQDALKAVDQ